MKSGISLVDMAKEIQRQADLKADYTASTNQVFLRSRTKSSRYLTTQYLRLRPPCAGNSPKLLQLWQLSRCTKRPPVSATVL